jgi:hypothetical protein
MRHHVAYENPAGSIVDISGQPILVPANVEDRVFASGIGLGVSFPHIHDASPP